jgi:hypothetical protein
MILRIFYFKDEKDAADRLAQEAKVRAKQAKDDVVRNLRIRVNEELPDEIRAQFDPLPKTIPEIDDAIGSANARIHLMGSADEQVLIDVNILFYLTVFDKMFSQTRLYVTTNNEKALSNSSRGKLIA